MNLTLVVKSTGSIWHWYDTDKISHHAICGDRPRRGYWRQARRPDLLVGKVICPTCAKIKAAQEGLEKLGLQEVRREN